MKKGLEFTDLMLLRRIPNTTSVSSGNTSGSNTNKKDSGSGNTGAPQV